jgi:serine/threonine-protein kinase
MLDSAALDRCLEDFHDALERGERPDLASFLPPGGADRRLLVELVHADLEFRLKAGERARVEEYVARLPELARDSAALRGLVESEFRLRRRRGETPDPAELRERFPDLTIMAGDTPPDGPPDSAAPAGRYELLGELGRGGMGAVLRGQDRHMGRDLAIKVLLDRHAADPGLRRRFAAEARTAGRLQHPGVAPVYELGELPDGRPFIAMKLVEGHTLADLLAGRPSPDADLPRFLKVFEQVCQAVAYAHSKGVIHRDLKPANVMVGAFGEVQVMDWGLAKVVGDGEPGAATPAATSPPPGGQTRDGQVLGTPAYMAPEQARGEVGRMDERADVFALGAILCEILTGRPPYTGEDAQDVLGQAAEANLSAALARLDGCGADAELVRLAKAYLAPRPEGRPPNAGEVAGAVGAYQAGVQERLRQAEVEAARATARAAAERKARRLTAGLAAAVLLLGVVGGGGAWLLQEQRAAARARQHETDRETRLALERARGLLQEGWQQFDLAKLKEAQAEADRAAAIAYRGEAAEAVRQEAAAFKQEVEERLARAEKNRILLAALLDVSAPRETRTYVSDDKGRLMALAEPSEDEQYAAAFRRWGLDIDGTAEAEVVARLRDEPEPVVQEILAGLDGWMLGRRRQKRPESEWQRLLRVAGQLDQNGRRRQLRALLSGESQPHEEAVAGLTRVLLPWTALCELERGPHWRRLLELRGQVDPVKEPVLSVVLLAQACSERGDAAGAEDVLRRAVAARPADVVLLDALGRLLERQGRLAGAIRYYQAVRARRPNLGIALGEALGKAGQAVEGEAVLRDLVRQQPNHPQTHVSLGTALHEKGRLDDAIQEYRKAIDLDPKLGRAHSNLGNALADQGRLDDAIQEYRKAIELDPKEAAAHTNLGIALKAKGLLEDAIQEYRRALDLDPKLAPARINLGSALREQGRLDDAIREYRRAIDLDPKLAPAHYNLGTALKGKGRLDDALQAYRTAIALDPKFAKAHYNLGNALADKGRLDDAIREYRQAIDLDPKHAAAHTNLGTALRAQGRLDDAIQEYQKAIDLRPDYAEAHCNLGHALRDQGHFRQALQALRRGHELGSKNPRWPYPSADWVKDCGRLADLDARLPAIIKGDDRPASDAERLDLARVCQYKQLYAASARFYADAFADQPRLAADLRAGHRYNAACAAALAAAGRGHDADQLGDKGRARLRRQALDWLRDDLAAWSQPVKGGKPPDRATAIRTLTHWGKDPDLAGVRDPAALAGLPADERAAWRKLWADVAALLHKAGDSPKR